MLPEGNGLLPFLEDWGFFVEPKIQSNTVFVLFPHIIFYLYDIYTNIQSLFAIVLTVHLNIRLNMAILLTLKLEKGLSSVRALNCVISRRCKILLNWTNQTKIQDKKDLDTGFQAGDSGFQSLTSKAQENGFHEKAEVFRILKSGLPLGDQ